MTADTLPDEVDFVFCPEALPEEEVHRVLLAVEGMARPIPTSLITLADEDARRVCDRLNRRLGPYLAWLSLTFLDRLPGGFLRPLPVRFGRFRYRTGFVARRSAGDLAPFRKLEAIVRETALGHPG